MKFKAAVLSKLNSKLSLQTIEMPKKLDDHQVLVKIKYSGICGSQIGEIKGVKGKDNYLPHLLGHEGSGVVIKKGKKVKKVNINDHVCLHWIKDNKSNEGKTPKYKFNNRRINAGHITTFNQFALISENRVTKINKNFPLDEAAIIGCAVLTGFGAVNNIAKVKPDSTAVVFGAGGIGLNIVQALKLKKVKRIIAYDTNRNQLNLAKKLGAHKIIQLKKNNYLKLSKSISIIKNIDYVFENTGALKSLEVIYNNIKGNIKIILIGVPHFNNRLSINTLKINLGISFLGCVGGNSNPSNDIPKIIKLIDKKKINLKKIIKKKIKFKDINKAISLMQKSNNYGRILLEF